jgi:hypothetical protein
MGEANNVLMADSGCGLIRDYLHINYFDIRLYNTNVNTSHQINLASTNS